VGAVGRDDAVGGLDVGLAVDAKLGDEDAQEHLGLLGLAVCDDGFELVGGRGQVGRCGRVCGLVGAVVGELGLLGAEVVEGGVQARDALFAALGGEPALLEGLEVALGRAFDAGNLRGDCVAAFIERGSLALRLLLSGGECVVYERAVAVDAGELVKDGGLQLLARGALALAGFSTRLAVLVGDALATNVQLLGIGGPSVWSGSYGPWPLQVDGGPEM
jgi:hypothetical protein